jgi:Fic family protein
MFQKTAPGTLVSIAGQDPLLGAWRHYAFVPRPLPDEGPDLSAKTYLAVAEARAALAALDSTARQLPNPTLLRMPTLRREAQSTSALEGTYAPLAEVFVADDEDPPSAELIEILNYVRAANYGFDWITGGRPVSVSFLSDLQGLLMRGTPLEAVSGRLRDTQVVINVARGSRTSG